MAQNYLDNKAFYDELLKCQKKFHKAVRRANPKATDPEEFRLARNKFGNKHAGGYMSDELANYFMLMVNHLAMLGKYRKYSYIDEMKSESLLRCTLSWYKFDCERFDNPFSYFTSTIERMFWSTLKDEKKIQTHRDDELERASMEPSFTRQQEREEKAIKFQHEMAHEFHGEDIPVSYDPIEFNEMLEWKKAARADSEQKP